MFGDNESVHSQLKKRYVAVPYHRVQEAIASGIVAFHHIRGELNPADILSKHWGFAQVWKVLQPLLFWKGETNIISDTIATKPYQAKGELQVSHHEGVSSSVEIDESDKTQDLNRILVSMHAYSIVKKINLLWQTLLYLARRRTKNISYSGHVGARVNLQSS